MSRVRTRLFVAPLESRLTPASAASAAVPYAIGSQAGQAASATVYKADGTVDFTVTPFASLKDFTGGVRTALADVTGDGTADLIAAAGPGGGSLVEIYDGAKHTLVDSFSAYETGFTGGTYIAAADLNTDGRAEVITGAAEDGGPRVRVFDGASLVSGQTPTVLDDFMAIEDPNFRGGVRLSLGDIGGDGVPDLLVGAGRGGGPRVAAFDGASLGAGQQVKLFADFFAFEPNLRNGVYPSVGDLNADGRGDLVFGAGPGGSPRVRALDARAILHGVQTELANFFAGNPDSRKGVEVGVTTNADGSTSIVGTDLSTNSTGRFGCDGKSQGALGTGTGTEGGKSGGEFGGPAFAHGGYTVADADTLSKSLVGSYTGTGSALITPLSGTGAQTGASGDVTVKVDITSASALLPTTSAGTDTSGLPLREMSVSGTVTVTTKSGTLTLPVTGVLQLARGRANDTSTVRGVLRLSTDRSGADPAPTGTGLAVTLAVSGGDLTVSRLLATDRQVSPGFIVQTPESRSATRIGLAKA